MGIDHRRFDVAKNGFFRDLHFGLPVPGHYTPSCLPGVHAGVEGIASPPPGSTPLYTQGRAEAGQRAFGHAHVAGREEDGAPACDQQSAQWGGG